MNYYSKRVPKECFIMVLILIDRLDAKNQDMLLCQQNMLRVVVTLLVLCWKFIQKEAPTQKCDQVFFKWDLSHTLRLLGLASASHFQDLEF